MLLRSRTLLLANEDQCEVPCSKTFRRHASRYSYIKIEIDAYDNVPDIWFPKVALMSPAINTCLELCMHVTQILDNITITAEHE